MPAKVTKWLARLVLKDINMDLVKVYPQGVETTPNHGLAATASSTATINDTGAIYVNSDGKTHH